MTKYVLTHLGFSQNFGFSRRDKSPSLQVFWSYLNCIEILLIIADTGCLIFVLFKETII